MRNNLLQKRAFCAALFVLLLNVVGMKNALAQNQVATLQHNDTITGVYYGQNAFSLAYDAAVSGDVITLSGGTFVGCNILKPITIHGAGCAYDLLTNVLPTVISGNISFYFQNCNTCGATIEGVDFIGTITFGGGSSSYGHYRQYYANNISFCKCIINSIVSHFDYERWNSQFVNCIINSFSSGDFRNTSFINSVVKFTNYIHNDINACNSFYNSIVLFDNGLSINNLIAYNSIFVTVSGHTVSNNSFFNTIGIQTGETSLFEGQTVNNVMTVDEYSDVFETFNGTILYESSYQLKEEIATTFLGQDGMEVGIYGGIVPYKTRPSYMILKNCNVAGQTDENKKLNVEMELIGPED
ncbi:MAG: hypothetical protein J6W30_07535 [Bacteroidales bacterium]|nr:hypothetical protein [Bacteroidales bacterium]